MCVRIWVCVLYACERVSVTLFFFFSFLFFSGIIKMVKVSRSGYRIEMVMLTYVADCKIRAVFMLIFFLLLFFYLHSVAHTFYCHKFLNRVNTHTHTHRKYLYMCIYFRLHNRDFFFFTYIFFLFLLARAHTHICSFNSFFDGRTKKKHGKKEMIRVAVVVFVSVLVRTRSLLFWFDWVCREKWHNSNEMNYRLFFVGCCYFFFCSFCFFTFIFGNVLFVCKTFEFEFDSEFRVLFVLKRQKRQRQKRQRQRHSLE